MIRFLMARRDDRYKVKQKIDSINLNIKSIVSC